MPAAAAKQKRQQRSPPRVVHFEHLGDDCSIHNYSLFYDVVDPGAASALWQHADFAAGKEIEGMTVSGELRPRELRPAKWGWGALPEARPVPPRAGVLVQGDGHIPTRFRIVGQGEPGSRGG